MAEIRRLPVEVGSLSHYLRPVLYIPGGCYGFLPSTVCSLLVKVAWGVFQFFCWNNLRKLTITINQNEPPTNHWWNNPQILGFSTIPNGNSNKPASSSVLLITQMEVTKKILKRSRIRLQKKVIRKNLEQGVFFLLLKLTYWHTVDGAREIWRTSWGW